MDALQTFETYHHCAAPKPSNEVNLFGGMECLSCGFEVVVGDHLAQPTVELSQYRDYLRTKVQPKASVGVDISASDIHPGLMDFQAAATRWALRKGRAALWLATGLGKTYCELVFGYHVGGKVLLFAPLAVGSQMVRMAQDWGFKGRVQQIKEPSEITGDGIWITNYQRAERFASIAGDLNGLVLDESSCLKDESAVTRKLLTEGFADVPYKLAASATPAPNDVTELTNHAEFLGVMKRNEVLATFMVHDEDGWRLRGHAVEPFYRWLATWAMVATSPADLGFEHEAARFALPALNVSDAVVPSEWKRPGELFPGFGLKGITDRSSVRRTSLNDRCMKAAEIIRETPGQWVVFCGLNDEQNTLAKYLGNDCVSIQGSTDEKLRVFKYDQFRLGHVRTLVTKGTLFGWGLNMQFAHNLLFLGLNDSFELYYQGVRRLWRYGQTEPVNVRIVVSDHETEIVRNVRAKEAEWAKTIEGMVNAMKEHEKAEISGKAQTETFGTIETKDGNGWTMHRGDCVEAMLQMPDNSVDLTVTSPPFLSLYTYSASERDVGNNRSPEEFLEQYVFVARQLKRITKPGRLAAIHCQQVATTLNHHGYIGLLDFRGMLIKAHQEVGWIYHGEILIDKNPQAQAIRTHSKALLFVQKNKDSAASRPALADYVLLFVKPGENEVEIKTDITNEEWIRLAHPVWYNIRESDTLNTLEAKEDDDERHVVPLQLETIENCVRLWSNTGETVYDPFSGVGSTAYVALQQGRKALGCELKPRYWETAIKNCQRALAMRKQQELFT